MKFFAVVFAIILAVASAQRQQFGRFSGYQGFGGFGGFGNNAAVQQRDPRANTGPVVFPQAPEDSGLTSGVVVGASGYGFVPPNQPGAKAQALPYF